ncbi:MAG: hypothetical protein AB7H43_15775 [Acidimicrobiia bacterium]
MAVDERGRLVATVVRYGQPRAWWWCGFVHGDPLPGEPRFGAAQEAK